MQAQHERNGVLAAQLSGRLAAGCALNRHSRGVSVRRRLQCDRRRLGDVAKFDRDDDGSRRLLLQAVQRQLVLNARGHAELGERHARPAQHCLCVLLVLVEDREGEGCLLEVLAELRRVHVDGKPERLLERRVAPVTRRGLLLAELEEVKVDVWRWMQPVRPQAQRAAGSDRDHRLLGAVPRTRGLESERGDVWEPLHERVHGDVDPAAHAHLIDDAAHHARRGPGGTRVDPGCHREELRVLVKLAPLRLEELAQRHVTARNQLALDAPALVHVERQHLPKARGHAH